MSKSHCTQRPKVPSRPSVSLLDMAAPNSQNDEHLSALSFHIDTTLLLQNVPNSTSADAIRAEQLSDEHRKYIMDLIIPYLQQACRDKVRPNFYSRELKLLIDMSEKPSKWKKSFTTHLHGTERESLQIYAHMWLQHELVDDRAKADGSKLEPEENERRSSAKLEKLYRDDFKELCSYWHSQEKLKKYVFYGEESRTILPNHDVRYVYFKTCLHHFRTNLRVLLRYNLVERMPSRINCPGEYIFNCITYRTGDDWLMKSLHKSIEELLRQNGNELPKPEPLVRWPGDDRIVLEPQSSLKNVFTEQVS